MLERIIDANAFSGLGFVIDTGTERIIFQIVVELIPTAQGKTHRRGRLLKPIFYTDKRAFVEIYRTIDLSDEIQMMRRGGSTRHRNQIEDKTQTERPGQLEMLALKLRLPSRTEIPHAHRNHQIPESRIEIGSYIHGKSIEIIRLRLPTASDKDLT